MKRIVCQRSVGRYAGSDSGGMRCHIRIAENGKPGQHLLDGAEPDFFNVRDIINGDRRIVDRGEMLDRCSRIANIADGIFLP